MFHGAENFPAYMGTVESVGKNEYTPGIEESNAGETDCLSTRLPHRVAHVLHRYQPVGSQFLICQLLTLKATLVDEALVELRLLKCADLVEPTRVLQALAKWESGMVQEELSLSIRSSWSEASGPKPSV